MSPQRNPENHGKKLHPTCRALDTIIRDHFVDSVASVVLPGSEDIIQFEKVQTNLEISGKMRKKCEKAGEDGVLEKTFLLSYYFLTHFISLFILLLLFIFFTTFLLLFTTIHFLLLFLYIFHTFHNYHTF